MRITFSNEHSARTAANVLERYGYRASRTGTVVVTDCPTLLAVPAVERAVGLGRVDDLDLGGSLRVVPAPQPELGATA
jgi:hypothetical protein